MAALLRTAKAIGEAGPRLRFVRRMSRTAPWLMLPPTSKGDDDNTVYNFYNLSDRKVVSFNAGNNAKLDGRRIPVGSSHGWLAVFNQSNCNLFLSDPISGRHIKLPSIRSDIRKVIVSTSPDDDGCLAMMTFGPTERLAFCVPGRSTKWTPIGDPPRRKTYQQQRPHPPYHDFVYSTRDETFFCVTECGYLVAWDLRNPQSPQMIMSCFIDEDLRLGEKFSLLKLKCMWQNYVVVADGGEILLVRQYIFTTDLIWEARLIRSDGSIDDWLFRSDGSFDDKSLEDAIRLSERSPGLDYESNNHPWKHKTVGFDVYKYDRKERRLSYLQRSLEGMALFIGLNHSWAVAAREFPQLKPNSIYFTDVIEQTPDDGDGGHDIGIFNYQDSTFSSCYYPYDFRSLKQITPSPIWFFPNLA